jgi:hypothetical protein
MMIRRRLQHWHHGALEVVVVGAFAGSAALAVEDPLDSVEQFRGDQRLVAALVFGALVGDVSEVVAVAQHPADFVDGDARSGRVPFGGLHP